MPTKREREYYAMGYRDGISATRVARGLQDPLGQATYELEEREAIYQPFKVKSKPRKRKLSAWNKFVKANSKKAEFRFSRSTGQYRKGQLNLKKMAVAFRKKRRR